MLDMTLRLSAAEQMAREAKGYTMRVVARANASRARKSHVDLELVAQSRDLISRARQRLAALDKPAED